MATTVVSDASADAYDQMAHGKALYERNCIVCHGPNGDMQGSGAKNLITSELSEAEARDRIVNGKNAMVGYGEIYSEEEIDAVHAYGAELAQIILDMPALRFLLADGSTFHLRLSAPRLSRQLQREVQQPQEVRFSMEGMQLVEYEGEQSPEKVPWFFAWQRAEIVLESPSPFHSPIQLLLNGQQQLRRRPALLCYSVHSLSGRCGPIRCSASDRK